MSIVTENKPHEVDQGLDQNGKRSGSGFLTWLDANVAPPVQRVDLTRAVVNAEHGKPVNVIPPWPFQDERLEPYETFTHGSEGGLSG